MSALPPSFADTLAGLLKNAGNKNDVRVAAYLFSHAPALLAAVREWSQAMRDVAEERRQHVTREGWTAEHDDEHEDGSLAKAAAAYAYHGGLTDGERRTRQNTLGSDYGRKAPLGWPDGWHIKWWKPKDRRRDLVRAAALIVAEIERLDRAALGAPR